MKVSVTSAGRMGVPQGGLTLVVQLLSPGPGSGATQYAAASLPALAGGETDANAARALPRLIRFLRNKPQDPARKALEDPNVQSRARVDQLRAAVKRWIDEIRAQSGRSNKAGNDEGNDGGPAAEVRPQWLADP